MTVEAMTAALQYVAREFVAYRHDFQREHGPMMWDGLVSKGYVKQGPDGLSLAEPGRRFLEDADKGADHDA